VGFLGTYLYDGIRWLDYQPDRHQDLAEPWLLANIHDSGTPLSCTSQWGQALELPTLPKMLIP
jgi:hypothetical protein